MAKINTAANYFHDIKKKPFQRAINNLCFRSGGDRIGLITRFDKDENVRRLSSFFIAYYP